MAIRLYRSDDIEGFEVSPIKNSDGTIKETAREVADRLIATANYTESQKEAQDALSASNAVTTTVEDTTTSSGSGYTAEQAQVLMPWLTKLAPVEGRKLIDEYVQGYIETGEATFALAKMRASDSYEKVFTGITRDDGSLRMTEAQYLQSKEAVLIHFNEFGVGGYGSQVIDGLFPELVANNVSPDEIASRLSVADRQLSNLSAEQKRNVLSAYEEYYSTELGEAIQLDDAALIPLVIDPEINSQILNRQLNVARIGNQYQQVAGVEASRTAIESLVGAGLQASEAQRTFQAAVDRALISSRLARRQNRTESPTSLDILEAQYLGDLETQAIEAQNISESTAQLGARRTGEGSVIGLTEQ